MAAAPLYAELCELLFTSMRGVAIVYAFEDRPAVTDPHLALWKRLATRMPALPEGLWPEPRAVRSGSPPGPPRSMREPRPQRRAAA